MARRKYVLRADVASAAASSKNGGAGVPVGNAGQKQLPLPNTVNSAALFAGLSLPSLENCGKVCLLRLKK